MSGVLYGIVDLVFQDIGIRKQEFSVEQDE